MLNIIIKESFAISVIIYLQNYLTFNPCMLIYSIIRQKRLIVYLVFDLAYQLFIDRDFSKSVG